MPTKRAFKMLIPPGFYANQCDGVVQEEFTSELLLIFSKGVKLLIDIGAHDTFLVGKRHPNCEMTAFEPVPENFEILERKGALDQLANIELHHLALSDKEGLKTLKITENSGQCGFYDQRIAKTGV
jgi:hypothetical protein